jgi:hypothetical protein
MYSRDKVLRVIILLLCLMLTFCNGAQRYAHNYQSIHVIDNFQSQFRPNINKLVKESKFPENVGRLELGSRLQEIIDEHELESKFGEIQHPGGEIFGKPTPSPTDVFRATPIPTHTGPPENSPTPSPIGETFGAPTPSPTGPPEKSPTPSSIGGVFGSPTPSPTGPPEKSPTPLPTDVFHGQPTPGPTAHAGNIPTPSGRTDITSTLWKYTVVYLPTTPAAALRGDIQGTKYHIPGKTDQPTTHKFSVTWLGSRATARNPYLHKNESSN